MRYVISVCLALAAFGCGPQDERPARQSPGSLTIDMLIDIKHPGPAVWAPDGRRVAFVWDRAGVHNIWTAEVGSGAPVTPRPATSYDAGLIDGIFWSRDGETLYFLRGGDLWRASPAGGQTEPVWTTSEVETELSFAPDGARVAFIRGGTLDIPANERAEGDVWVRSLADGREIRVTNTPGRVEASPVWSPDGAKIAFTVVTSSRREEAPAYSGVKVVYTSFARSPADVEVLSATGGRPTAIAATPDAESSPRWVGSGRLVLQRVSDHYRKRQIIVADAATGQGRVAHEEVDGKWWSIPGAAGAGPAPSPDGRWIAFVSDRDGWDHVYVVASDGGSPVQVTRGPFEAWRPAWSRDSTRIAFDANEEPDHPGSRHLGIANIGPDPAKAQITMVTAGRGTDIAPNWSPDGRRLLYQHTDARNSADLVVTDATAGGPATRLTDSLPAAVDRPALVEPEFVHYAAPDGKQVPAYLFVPRGLDRSRRHPAIVWIHGDGTNQNYDGWHVQRNYAVYYSFHQYLLQKGYVVLAPDYRGSIGYGRDWRQGVYMEVGGKDADDAAAGGTYLKTLDYVDPDRIGVWGLSYGGFFTLLAMTRAPTLFRCGVDVAGTVDYLMYLNAWTFGRMGTPEESPAAYEVAAPVKRVNQLVRPLLVLHGTSDVNVPFLHSIRLVDELLKNGKDFEFMVYPGEFHYFQRAHVLADAWTRTERFFDKHLRTP